MMNTHLNRVLQDNKKRILDALERSLGNVTVACKAAGLDRTTFYNYYNKDKKFRKAADDIENVALDFVEGHLLKNIKGGKEASTIFYMKTKGRKRGYIEKYDLGIQGKLVHKIQKFNIGGRNIEF